MYDVTAWLGNIYNPYIANISRSKDNQTMEFGQSIKHNKKKIFLKNPAQNEAERPVTDLFLFLKKLYKK